MVVTVAAAAGALHLLHFDPADRAGTVAGSGATGDGRQRARPPLRASVTVPVRGPSVAIPQSFLGFSTEYWSLPDEAGHAALFARIVSLVRAPGGGPFLLRIGGVSSDHAIWDPTGRRLARWAFPLTRGWLQGTAALDRRAGLRVIADLNLITAMPRQDAAFARSLRRTLPPHSLIGLEIGNEPDVYLASAWGLRLLGLPAIRRLPATLTAAGYVRSYDADARALATAAPGIPLLGPALAEPRVNRRWATTLLDGATARPAAITVHDYPYTACTPRRAGNYPTIERLLSNRTIPVQRALIDVVRLAAVDAVPVRVTEFNSISCGGVAGVSNTFATALWAPSALFAMVRAGVRSADLHVRAFSINAPFRFSARGVWPRPLLYGLIAFTRMLGPGARLLDARVRARPVARLSAWVVQRDGGGFAVLLIDRGQRPIRVRLRIAGGRRAIAMRLLARSAQSTGGVTLGGLHLDPQARWVGRPARQILVPRRGVFELTLRGASAALVMATRGG
ncbi:MAG: hypothetical protein JOZ07_19695 [Solirubrobacterales bacterium]|nr:hypothetical protein [Solirubrobacterales bacterium]